MKSMFLQAHCSYLPLSLPCLCREGSSDFWVWIGEHGVPKGSREPNQGKRGLPVKHPLSHPTPIGWS